MCHSCHSPKQKNQDAASEIPFPASLWEDSDRHFTDVPNHSETSPNKKHIVGLRIWCPFSERPHLRLYAVVGLTLTHVVVIEYGESQTIVPQFSCWRRLPNLRRHRGFRDVTSRFWRQEFADSYAISSVVPCWCRERNVPNWQGYEVKFAKNTTPKRLLYPQRGVYLE